MPLLRVHTNQNLESEAKDKLLKEASSWLAEQLDKSETYILVHLLDGQAMTFAGTRAPAAMVELASLGLTTDQARRLAGEISSWLAPRLGVAPNRMHIWFAGPDRALWGFDGKTFG